ncbi:MAG: HypC/HybG/HupF family hydrogenase formation chaperone [Armatimonadetes bacterium CG_4_10_14_3_um_filter_66_18]|nr:MAG: HypC/HybG/HupF family hydrogenase formation chaperone [Armatimonadetes bacterium CG06_land_8_20_14_3_00_66_21]PIY53648.1 MAG: HypC/HybG/HupF family hydrogenase formation chaperone [Armatimonadetes bacterium CG_4_10_14_3_um_filter_66_18]
MCLAVPAKIIDLPSPTEGIVDMGGVQYPTDLTLVEGAALGDYVIVHAGFAIQKLDEQEAQETLALFRELAELAAAEESRQGET